MDIYEWIEILEKEFIDYIPDDRESLSDISPRTIYYGILCSIENFVRNKM